MLLSRLVISARKNLNNFTTFLFCSKYLNSTPSQKMFFLFLGINDQLSFALGTSAESSAPKVTFVTGTNFLMLVKVYSGLKQKFSLAIFSKYKPTEKHFNQICQHAILKNVIIMSCHMLNVTQSKSKTWFNLSNYVGYQMSNPGLDHKCKVQGKALLSIITPFLGKVRLG